MEEHEKDEKRGRGWAHWVLRATLWFVVLYLAFLAVTIVVLPKFLI